MENTKIDLHTHTCISDGNQSPLRLLVRANKVGINILSITDHNSVAQYALLEKQILSCKDSNKPKFKKILAETKVIYGIELTTYYKEHVIDILAYNYNIKKMQRNVSKLLKNLPSKRPILKAEFLKIIKQHNLKFDLTTLDNAPILYLAFYKELKKHKENDFICHNIYTPKQFLQHMYNDKSPFYINVSSTLPNIHNTLECIHKSDGIAFIAHLGRYSSRVKYELDNIISCGLDGIEVWYPWHNNDLQNYLLNKVVKYNLLASGGSDNHYIIEKEKCFGLGSISLPNTEQTLWIKNSLNTNNDFLSHSSKIQKWLSNA